MYKDILEYSNKIKEEASEILEKYKILNILDNSGIIKVIGSYDLNLMYDRDIDILVNSSDIKNASYEALLNFIKTENFSKIEYGDFVNFPRENRPKGYILNLKLHFNKEKWEIEIWFLSDISKNIAENDKIKEKLNEENRSKILLEKRNRELNGITKLEKSSYKIYSDILNF